MGRRHRAFFRVCAMDSRSPRGGKVLEELGTYDPMLPETDARAILKDDRIDYWLGVGAQPTEKVNALIRKYGTDGTHADRQKAALERMAVPKVMPDPGAPASLPKKPEPIPEPAPKPEAKAKPKAKAKAKAEAPASDAAPEASVKAEAAPEAPVKTEAAPEAPAEAAPAEATPEPAAEAAPEQTTPDETKADEAKADETKEEG